VDVVLAGKAGKVVANTTEKTSGVSQQSKEEQMEGKRHVVVKKKSSRVES
jgi:membrane protein implicated in regulation of membrane protease activity